MLFHIVILRGLFKPPRGMDIISIRGFSVYHEGTAIQCYLVPSPCSLLEVKVIIYFLIGKLYFIILLVCFERQGHCRSDLSLATVESATQQLFNTDGRRATHILSLLSLFSPTIR